MEYRIAIIGSRDFNNFDFLDKKVKELMPKQDYQFIIVSGGAKGTDTLAESLQKNITTIQRYIEQSGMFMENVPDI